MKKLIFFILLLWSFTTEAQNEFAATAFYTELNKIFDDARQGFLLNKGSIRESENPGLVTEYKVTFLLPLADSGKISVPEKGDPYVVYYFEPEKIRLKTDQRGANLRDAILSSLNQALYAITETTLVDEKPLTNTWYFTNDKETRHNAALFQISIYYQSGKYYLSLLIRGNK
ncbi:MAG TPA: hypothetical protein VFV31_04200 [Chitinophagaceae bacterium]|nr:hypothetical protein [Chitinophagaceae bacterium]